MKKATLPLRNSINRLPVRRGFLLIPLVLACFALPQTARAVDPPPDGGYPNETTAEGDSALLNLQTAYGLRDTAVGFHALLNNTTGSYNTAVGGRALESNISGTSNTAVGNQALWVNTASNNTAVGSYALHSNTTGYNNTGTGTGAIINNDTGFNNTADGVGALALNSSGRDNTAVGLNALLGNTSGNANVALGINAGSKLTTGNNNIDIGHKGVAGDADTIRIGQPRTQKHTFIAGVSGETVAGGVGVIIDTNGHLGTVVSSMRYKDAIQPMKDASKAILSLKPVTFRYKHELDPAGIPQFGLVAEEVAKVNPDLVARDEHGKPYTVRYEAVNAMLLNEFIKEHRKVEEQTAINQRQEAAIAQQQKEIQVLTGALKAQAAQIQNVSDQLRIQAPTPRVAANN